jgi:hypothetical protein
LTVAAQFVLKRVRNESFQSNHYHYKCLTPPLSAIEGVAGSRPEDRRSNPKISGEQKKQSGQMCLNEEQRGDFVRGLTSWRWLSLAGREK